MLLGPEQVEIRYDERHTRRTLNAFIAGRYEYIETGSFCADIDGAERTHCIYNGFYTSLRCQINDGFEWIEHTGGCFTMNETDVCNR
ncbi:hypothetical protein ALQ07_200103 [Pseudomonas syringae pv. actinidiae]|uniref:Uncharacterized protein n=1 Tax=Pseudomonas syringae pv. actinidiae TaxID=103796 RepID=A0A3M4K5H4_PSESF|nr:hypothetical protein ALO84_200075 [Pseudomonas syringae pv. maculicola]RMQ24528.1 hypothetical protein ALQ07_200103 [Pseudomonas syringae pv. actinidiae]